MTILKKTTITVLLSFSLLNASDIHLQCVTVYSIFSPIMYKTKNYDIAQKIDIAAQNHMNELKKNYSNELIYSLLIQENKKIFLLMNNVENKEQFNKLAGECFSRDNLRL